MRIWSSIRALGVPGAPGVVLLATVACSAPQVATTRLQSSDFVTMTDRMAASLSAALADASEGSAGRRVIVLGKPLNLSNDVIPAREAQAFLARLRALLAESAVGRRPDVAFVLVRERSEDIAEREGDERRGRLAPTHELNTTFYSATSRTRKRRSDTFLCAFQLARVDDGRVVWEDRYEVKRSVARNELD